MGAGTGRATGAAFDPVMLRPGVYPHQEIIDASLQLDTPLDTGGVLFFAVDSRLTDPATFSDPATFYADREPLENTLWVFLDH